VVDGPADAGRSQLGIGIWNAGSSDSLSDKRRVEPAMSPASSSSSSSVNVVEARVVEGRVKGLEASSGGTLRALLGGAEPDRSSGACDCTNDGVGFGGSGILSLSTSISFPSSLEIAWKSNPAVLGIARTSGSSSTVATDSRDSLG